MKWFFKQMHENKIWFKLFMVAYLNLLVFLFWKFGLKFLIGLVVFGVIVTAFILIGIKRKWKWLVGDDPDTNQKIN